MSEQEKSLEAFAFEVWSNGHRHKLPEGECSYCDRERAANNDFHPAHDASRNCKSGRHPHCTCDTCW